MHGQVTSRCRKKASFRHGLILVQVPKNLGDMGAQHDPRLTCSIFNSATIRTFGEGLPGISSQ